MEDKKKTTKTMRVLMVVLVLSLVTGCFNGLNPVPSEPPREDWANEVGEEGKKAEERKNANE